jgi:hypothetical protein
MVQGLGVADRSRPDELAVNECFDWTIKAIIGGHMNTSLRRTSWIDLLIGWIERLPIPVWAFYLLFSTIFMLLNWVLVGSEFSFFDLAYSTAATIFIIGLVHAIHRVAASAFDQFASSLDASQEELEESRRRFVFAPAWLGLIALLLGLMTAAQEFAYTRQELGLEVAPGLVLFAVLLNFGSNSAFTMYFLGNTLRRLGLVIRLHRQIGTIDLFNLDSLRAFSRFSSGTAIGLILMLLVSLRFYLESTDDIENLMFLVVVMVLAAAVFLIPLIGLRSRIARARDQRITGIMADVDWLANQIRAAVRDGQLDEVGT